MNQQAVDQSTETRELFTLNSLEFLLRGTHHLARDRRSGAEENRAAASRTGVLLLNPLSLPRSATGDSAAFWADSFAERGYPSFRLDLPGCGDSEGEVPMALLDFINAGGHASIASAAATELAERFALSGLVLMGHCASAVSAIYAAAASRNCRGLVLMDPYFHLPQVTKPKMRQRMADRLSQSHFGGIFNAAFERLRDVRQLLRGNRSPENANLALLHDWKRLAAAQLPVLIFKSARAEGPDAILSKGDFDYLAYVQELAGKESQVSVKAVPGANHSFADPIGREAIRASTESWLQAHFPLPISL